MGKDLISIIIPVYNVENYIIKCIDSVLNQTYTNLEIIFIDDGSTDNSGNICDEYASKDNRIKVIHKKNGGLSEARNRGIEESKGKYITFLDSDDYIQDDYIEYLYGLIKKYNVEMSISSYYIETNKKTRINIGVKYKEKLMNTEEALERMLCEEGYSVSAWAKMYDRNLFEHIKYPAGKICEDNGTTYKIIKKCKNIAYGNESKYIYVKRDGSIMNSKFNLRKLDLIELIDQMANELEKEFPGIKDSIERRKIYARFSVLRQAINDKNVDKNLIKKLRKEILQKWKMIFTNKKVDKRDKAAFFMLLLGKKVYKFSWNFYNYIRYRR